MAHKIFQVLINLIEENLKLEVDSYQLMWIQDRLRKLQVLLLKTFVEFFRIISKTVSTLFRMIRKLSPIRDELIRLKKDKIFIEKVLNEGRAKAEERSLKVIREVREIIGLW